MADAIGLGFDASPAAVVLAHFLHELSDVPVTLLHVRASNGPPAAQPRSAARHFGFSLDERVLASTTRPSDHDKVLGREARMLHARLLVLDTPPTPPDDPPRHLVLERELGIQVRAPLLDPVVARALPIHDRVDAERELWRLAMTHLPIPKGLLAPVAEAP